MSKQKSRRIATKRFKLTKKGKLFRKICNSSHLNRKEDVSTKHRKDRKVQVKGKYKAKIKKMMNK